MSKEWTKEELVKAFTDFQEAATYVMENWNPWYDKVGTINECLSDISHAVELNTPTTTEEKAALLDQMKDFLETRRKCKDLQDIFREYSLVLKDHVEVVKAVDAVKEEFEFQQGGRVYSPRQLHELFTANKQDF